MSAIANFPVTVTAEAEAYIDNVGKRTTFEKMLNHIPVHYAGLQSVSVSMEPDYGIGEEPRVVIQVFRKDPGYPDGEDQRWDCWLIENIATEDYYPFCVYSFRV